MTTPIDAPCDEWAEKLAAHGEHISPSDRTALEAHLAACPACSLAYADYHMMRRLMHTLPAPDFPGELPPRLLHIWEQEDSDRLNEEELRSQSTQLHAEKVRSNALHPVSAQVDNVFPTQEVEPLADQILQCSICGRDFLFTASDQAFFLAKGVTERPKRCPSCRSGRQNTIPADDPLQSQKKQRKNDLLT